MFNLRPPGQKPLLGTPLDYSNPLSQGLVGAWVMNEGSGDRIYDASGNAKDGVFDGTFWAATSKGVVPTNDSEDDKIDISSLILSGTMSVISSVRAKDGLARQQILHGDNTLFYWVQNDVPNRQAFYNGAGYVYDNTGFPVDEWITIAVTNDVSKPLISFYQNGNFTASNASAIDTTHTNISLMGTNSGGDYLVGSMEYCYIYDRILSPHEIAELHVDPYQMWPDYALWMISTPGWAHKWNGIAGASIAAINRVPTANIAKINTV